MIQVKTVPFKAIKSTLKFINVNLLCLAKNHDSELQSWVYFYIICEEEALCVLDIVYSYSLFIF